jgi:hypothetical protein
VNIFSAGKTFSHQSGTVAPVSTTGPQATSFKTMAANPLLRIRSLAKKAFGETVGEATGFSAPSDRGGFADWMLSSGPGFERLRLSWMRRDQTMQSFVHDWLARHVWWGRAPRGRLG